MEVTGKVYSIGFNQLAGRFLSELKGEALWFLLFVELVHDGWNLAAVYHCLSILHEEKQVKGDGKGQKKHPGWGCFSLTAGIWFLVLW
jgi:hypothetical protein